MDGLTLGRIGRKRRRSELLSAVRAEYVEANFSPPLRRIIQINVPSFDTRAISSLRVFGWTWRAKNIAYRLREEVRWLASS